MAKSGKWMLTKTKDKIFLAKNWLLVASGFLTSRIATALIGFLLTLLLPNVIELDDLGRLYATISLVTILTVLQRFGLDYWALNLGLGEKNSKDSPNKIFVNCILTLLFWSAVISIPVFFSIEFLVSFYNEYEFISKNFIPIFIWSTSLSITYVLFQMYKVINLPIMSTLTRVFFHNSLIFVVLLIVFLSSDTLSIEWALWAFSLSATFVAILNSLYFYSLGEKKFKLDINLFKVYNRLKKTSLYFCYSAALVVLAELDVWLVLGFFGPTEVAIYATAKRFLLFVAVFSDFSNVILPKKISLLLRENKKEDAQSLIRRFALITSVLGLLVTFIIWMYGASFFEYAYSGKMNGSLPILLILNLGSIYILAVGAAEIVLLLQDGAFAKSALFISSIIATIAQIFITFFLVDRFGLYGIAFGAVIGVVFYRTLLMLIVVKRYSIFTFLGR